MKKLSCLMAVLLVLCLVGCGKEKAQSGAASSPAQSGVESVTPEEPLHLESLTVEFQRGATDSALLLKAVKELPAALQSVLEESGVTVDEVSVTIGSSCEATAQAVAEGGVDLAFLPAAELARVETCPEILLVTGGEEDGAPGQRMTLCAADTDYGRNLAGRESPTWTELDNARWGVLGSDSLLGYQAVELWLSDGCEGNGIEDLSKVTAFDTWEALFAAAAAGEIDVFPSTKEQLPEGTYAVLGQTERLYTMAVAASADAADARLAGALAEALELLQEDYVNFIGDAPYAPAPENALDPQRRIAVLLG